MLKRLLFVLFLGGAAGFSLWYWWADVLPLVEKYDAWLGRVGSFVTIGVAAISLLGYVFVPRPKEKETEPSLITAKGDVVIGKKEETHYHHK